MEVTSGQLLCQGRFEVLARLGEGGGGVVYEVRDRRSDARLALKTLRFAEADSIASLKREFRAVQDVTHPNLVRLDDLFEEDGEWFFTMELIEGVDWLSHVRNEGRMDAPRVRATLVQIVDALSALHAVGTVHRDVKPSNVLVDRGGQVKVLDFGIAARARRGDVGAHDGVVGTVSYMSPEQLLAEDPTPAGDFYSVGVMLYEALTGDVPFPGRITDAIRMKLASPAPPVRDATGAAPGDLVALCDALLRSEPTGRPSAGAILRALGVTGAVSSSKLAVRDDFVGRAPELASLREAFAAVTRGESVTIVVEGASGVGKSALVQRFLQQLEDRSSASSSRGGPLPLVLEGRCHEREYVPYNGLDAIVDDLAAHLAATEPLALSRTAAVLLPRLFPALRSVALFADAASTAPPGEPHELRAQSFAAFRELVQRVAETRRLVLSIDDVQWADGDTLALLGDALAPPSPPILVVCTRRSAEEAPEHAGAPPPRALPGQVRRIELGGLPNADVRDLAVRLSGSAGLDRAELATVVEESRGHPLFLAELVRRSLRGDAGSHVHLEDALWSRVAALGETERRIVEAIAVSGAPTPLDFIAAAAAVPLRELPQSLAALRSANLVRLSGPSSRQRIEAYHDRVRAAVVQNLAAHARRDWHERLARAKDDGPERDVESLAPHWEEAGDLPRAAALYREAAERAGDALAFDRAVGFYDRALALLDASAREREALERARAEALFNAGRGGEAGRAFLERVASKKGRAAIETQNRAAEAFLMSGHFDDGIEALRGAVAAVGLSFPGGRFAALFKILWYRFLLRVRGLGFEPREVQADAPDALRVDVCWSAAHGLALTDAMIGVTFHAIGVRLALKLGDPQRAARSLFGHAVAVSTGGKKAERRTSEIIRVGRAIHARFPHAYTEAFAETADGFQSFMLEDWKAALPRFERAETILRERCVGKRYDLSGLRMMRARTLVNLGRFTDLDEYAGPLLRDAVRRNDRYSVANTRAGVTVLLALARDDVPGAENDAKEAEAALSSRGFQVQHALWLNARGAIDLYRGEPGAALARLDAHAARLRRSLLETIQSIRVTLMYLRARAHVALAASTSPQKRKHLAAGERAARRLEREGLPAALAYASVVRAGCGAADGDRATATALSRDALRHFDDAEMRLHAASLRYVLGTTLCRETDEAGALVATACACLAEQRVAVPARFAAMYCPGFGVELSPSRGEPLETVEIGLARPGPR